MAETEKKKVKREFIMKKRVYLLALIGLMAITGCGNKTNEDVKPQDTTVEKVALEDTADTDLSEDENKASEAKEDPDSESEDATVQEDKSEDVAKEGVFSFSEVSNLEFSFSSGAGGWSTELIIKEDGSFHGMFHDSDMGSTGEGYENGTVYFSRFNGTFTEPEEVNDHTVKFKIKEINYENEVGTEEISDDTKYIYSEAYGLDQAEDLYIYRPGTSIDEFSDDLLIWLHIYDRNETDVKTTTSYVFYNKTPEYGFESYEKSDPYEIVTYYLNNAVDEAKVIEDRLQTEDLTQMDMNSLSGEIYSIWDSTLNAIWVEVKDNLDSDKFEKVLEEQRAWVKEKEEQVTKAGQEYEGGSIQALIENDKAAELTKERAYQLAEYLK